MCYTTNSTSWPREDDNNDEDVIFVALSFIFLFIGVFGNIAVIIYNIFLNHDKTPSSWLVTHLAFADLLVCLIIYPKKMFRFFHAAGRDYEVFCKITHTTTYVFLFLSIMFLLSITIDKYLYIVAKPLNIH